MNKIKNLLLLCVFFGSFISISHAQWYKKLGVELSYGYLNHSNLGAIESDNKSNGADIGSVAINEVVKESDILLSNYRLILDYRLHQNHTLLLSYGFYKNGRNMDVHAIWGDDLYPNPDFDYVFIDQVFIYRDHILSFGYQYDFRSNAPFNFNISTSIGVKRRFGNKGPNENLLGLFSSKDWNMQFEFRPGMSFGISDHIVTSFRGVLVVGVGDQLYRYKYSEMRGSYSPLSYGLEVGVGFRL